MLADREIEIALAKALGYKVATEPGDGATPVYYRLLTADGRRVKSCIVNGTEDGAWGSQSPRFVESLNDAWQVVEALRARGWTAQLTCNDVGCNFAFWHTIDRQRLIYWSNDPNPARAICLAACRALGLEVEGGD